MLRRRSLLLLLLLALLAIVFWRVHSADGSRTPPAALMRDSPRASAGQPTPKTVVVRSGGPRSARPPDSALAEAARSFLKSGGRAETCGSYQLYTDIGDARLIDQCERLAKSLDRAYRDRFGVEPIGDPLGAIVLFGDLADYRRYVARPASDGQTRAGYGGHASAARGIVVLYQGPQDRRSTLRTLAHELAHLVHRRALGPNLPRWLSEGLADGIGDTATEAGLRSLRGIEGSEGEARRLELAYRAGRVGSIARLVGLKTGEFDRGVVSYDYEQSAFLVRYLLADPLLAPRFRRFLQRLAAGDSYSTALLFSALQTSAEELDRGLETWFLAALSDR